MLRTVVVIDPNEDLRLSLCDLLTLEGYRCIGGSYLSDVRGLLKSDDIVVCDIKDPDLSSVPIKMLITMSGWSDRPADIMKPEITRPLLDLIKKKETACK